MLSLIQTKKNVTYNWLRFNGRIADNSHDRALSRSQRLWVELERWCRASIGRLKQLMISRAGWRDLSGQLTTAASGTTSMWLVEQKLTMFVGTGPRRWD